MDEKLQQEFIQFLGTQLKAKDQKDLENKVKNLSKEDLKKYYDAFVEYKKNQKVKAAFGAKLNYIKALKNECAENEKLVIFKSGGKTGCGCKKLDLGGETPKKQTSEQKPKKPVIWTKKDDAKLDSLTRRELLKQPLTPQGKLDLKNLRKKWKEASNKEQFELEAKKGGKLNKDCGGSAIVKSFKAKCGTKMKKHQQGGNLEEDVSLLDMVPVVSTLRDFRRAYNNPTFGNIARTAVSAGTDLLSLGVGSAALKAALKARKISKLLKSRGFTPITKEGNTYMKVEKIPANSGIGLNYKATFKKVPTLDATPVVMQTIVDPAVRSAKTLTMPVMDQYRQGGSFNIAQNITK